MNTKRRMQIMQTQVFFKVSKKEATTRSVTTQYRDLVGSVFKAGCGGRMHCHWCPQWALFVLPVEEKEAHSHKPSDEGHVMSHCNTEEAVGHPIGSSAESGSRRGKVVSGERGKFFLQGFRHLFLHLSPFPSRVNALCSLVITQITPQCDVG